LRIPPHKAHAIATGRTTTLCIPVKPGKAGAPVAPCPFKAGQQYAVPEPLNDVQRAAIKRGDQKEPPPLGHVRVMGTPLDPDDPDAVIGVPRGPLIVTAELAKAAGHTNPGEMQRAWVREWDRAWIDKHARDFNWARYTGQGTVSWILHERFRQRWEGREVWTVRFELVTEVRYLAQPDPLKAQGDYTPTPARAIDTLSAVDAAYQEKLSKDALSFCVGRQLKRQREMSADQAERKAQRRPWLRAA
jgi:hypothetical protein